jgi:hypothetical protein
MRCRRFVEAANSLVALVPRSDAANEERMGAGFARDDAAGRFLATLAAFLFGNAFGSQHGFGLDLAAPRQNRLAIETLRQIMRQRGGLDLELHGVDIGDQCGELLAAVRLALINGQRAHGDLLAEIRQLAIKVRPLLEDCRRPGRRRIARKF